MPSEATCASVARIGAELMTGDAIRTRRCAEPIALAIRCASFSPRPGQNHARIPSTGAVSTLPLCATLRVVQSCSKSSRYRAATAAESTVTITFSSRVHESAVQFVDPVHTEARVAHDVLVVHEVGYARDRGRRERHGLDRVGIGDRRRRHRHLHGVVEVVRQADGDAALGGGGEGTADDLVELRREVEVVDRDLERLLRVGTELSERVGGLLGRLAAVDQRPDFDASHSALCAFFAAW